MLKANANKQSSGIQKQIQSTNETRSEEEKEVVKKAQKEAGVKKKQNLLTVRMDGLRKFKYIKTLNQCLKVVELLHQLQMLLIKLVLNVV